MEVKMIMAGNSEGSRRGALARWSQVNAAERIAHTAKMRREAAITLTHDDAAWSPEQRTRLAENALDLILETDLTSTDLSTVIDLCITFITTPTIHLQPHHITALHTTLHTHRKTEP